MGRLISFLSGRGSAAFLSVVLFAASHAYASTAWDLNSFKDPDVVGGGGFVFNNNSDLKLWNVSLSPYDLILKASFNGVSFNNTDQSDQLISPWGGLSGSQTYGQTFAAPATKLFDFSFFIGSLDPADSFTYQAFVMTWTGNPLATADQSSSTLLYASNLLTYSGDANVVEVKSVIGGGGLDLVVGQNYVFGLTTVRLNPVGPGMGVSVPDNGSVLMLLGLALASMAAAHRRFAGR